MSDSGSDAESSDAGTMTAPLPSDLILVIFIHGFKGTDSTFSSFPERLQHVLSKTIDNVNVECIVFPEYETKGDLAEAVERFSEWLTKLTVEKEVANGMGGGAGKAKIVLCGHSMGGLLAADTLIQFVRSRPDTKAPLWPRIIACLAFDTPYLGLHPHVFKHGATRAAEYVQTAKTVVTDVFTSFQAYKKGSPSSNSPPTKPPIAAIESAPPAPENTSFWAKWGSTAVAVGGAVAAASAAAGAAYYKKEDIGIGYLWAVDHMKYVGNLWDEEALKARLDIVIGYEESMNVLFRTFYTLLPASPPAFLTSRTFIVLPPHAANTPTTKFDSDDSVSSRFLTAPNGIAADEIQAHTGMFEAKTNDGYYQLGLEVSRVIREAVMLGRGVVEDETVKVAKDIAVNDELTNAMEDVQESTGTVHDAVEANAAEMKAKGTLAKAAAV